MAARTVSLFQRLRFSFKSGRWVRILITSPYPPPPPPPSPPQSLNLSTEFGKGWRKMVAWSDQIKQMAPFSGFPTSCYGKLHKDFRLFRRPVFPLPLTTTVTFEMFVIFGFTTNTGLWKCVDWWSFDIDWQRFVNEGRATLFQTRLNLRRNWNLSGDWSAG